MTWYRAYLKGRNEVPPVKTLACGDAVFHWNQAANRLSFKLAMRNIRKATQGHIHLGRKGENGPVVAYLFGPSKFGITVRRGVVRGILRNCDLTGPLKGKTIRDLVREIARGNTYVNVHTVQHPNGEIRGQILCK